jgi:glycogen debranching enzyme
MGTDQHPSGPRQDNPYLGTGLIAGYGLSGFDGRPGFDWFFGRDALWTSLALNAEGDFATTRTALTFLAKYQRADGKITHEIAQTASLVPGSTISPTPTQPPTPPRSSSSP